jgi:aldehyde:ferredoxin oxidoreductase
MEMMNGRIVSLDLSSGEVTETQLDEDIVLADPSCVMRTDAIWKEHGEDSVVLGTGLLTGSLVPGACAGVMAGETGIMPIMGNFAVEMKLSGFDFIALTGKAPGPGYVWARDGIVEFVRSDAVKHLDSWGRTDRVRDDQGDRRIQVLSAGPWGDSGNPCAQLVNCYWGGEDKAGLASRLASKNVLAVAVRGMGELSVVDPDAHFTACTELRSKVVSKLGEPLGLASYFGPAGRDDLAALVHRHVACFGCPHPCRTFAKVAEDPKQMALSHKEPGYLHYDVPGLRKAFEVGLDARSATEVLMMCARMGAEPVAVLERASSGGRGLTPAIVRELLATPWDMEPLPADRFAGGFAIDRALAMGLCPRLWAKAGFDTSAIMPCVESAVGRGVPL